MAKKNKAERELEFMHAACTPHQKQAAIDSSIEARKKMLEPAFETLVAQSKEEVQRQKQKQYIENIRNFKEMVRKH